MSAPRLTLRRNRRLARGQTLPLACISLIFMALMTLLSFNIANVIHEKIRLQNYSDAQAFSMATIEARTFNYLAYSNRASAAAFVTIASLHGFYAVANTAPQLLKAAAMAMGIEALAELAVCVASWGTAPCCSHIATAAAMVPQFINDANDAEDTLEGWEQPFNRAVKGLWDAVQLIHLEQEIVLGSTAMKLQQGFGDALKGTMRNAAQLPAGVGMLNMRNMYCSTEGSMADMCSARTNETDRAKLFTEIINASRPRFSHHIGQMGLDYLPFIGQKWSDLTYSIPAFYGGEHALADDSCSPEVGAEGQLACGTVTPVVGFVGSAEDLPGVGVMGGTEIYSDENGGDHSPSGAHSGQHDEFKGIPRCVQDKNCFVNFRGDPDDEKTWGMPSAFAYYQADLSLRPKQASKRPWVLGDDGRISLDMGGEFNGETGMLQMTPTRTGAAMSRALVYFHAPGKWARPPNFFDPFWHSKLHPFDTASMTQVLGASGDDKMSDAPAMVVIEGAFPPE